MFTKKLIAPIFLSATLFIVSCNDADDSKKTGTETVTPAAPVAPATTTDSASKMTAAPATKDSVTKMTAAPAKDTPSVKKMEAKPELKKGGAHKGLTVIH